MTANKRIFLNVIATYGRSLYSLVIGLICGRWTLQALGEVDYGLLAVIGGLTFFISYFNTLVVGAISRFYAVSVGKERANPVDGLEEVRKWFSISVVIQFIWPTMLLVVGYPIGIWAIHNFLNIPPDRVSDCVWVWRYTCLSSYISMVTVPWNSMYRAKQYIAELTIYSFVITTLNAFFIYYMVSHPGVWMTKAALWGSMMGVCPNLIIALRGHVLFRECRFNFRYVANWNSFKELGSYGFWNAFGILGAYIKGQGTTIVINKFFGARINAGAAIGSTVSGHCNSLASSLEGAFNPAIYNAWGSGDKLLAHKLAFRQCKIGSLLVLIFAIPLTIEVKEVLLLWLKNPPNFAAEMTIFVLAQAVIYKLCSGEQACIDANGRIAKYQLFDGLGRIAILPMYLAFIYFGCDLYSIGLGLLLSISYCDGVRLYFAKKLCDMSISYWFRRIFLPILSVIIIGCLFGFIPTFLMPASFLRVCVTTSVAEFAIVPFAWFLILDSAEREYFRAKFSAMLEKIKKGK